MASKAVVEVMGERHPMSKKETKRRAELEGVVMKNMAAFLEMGQALAEIQRDRLYRSTHKRWEAYVRDVFEIGKAYAHRQIAGFQVVENIRLHMKQEDENVANWRQIMPANEAQVRPLTLLDSPEEQVAAWKEALVLGEESKRGKVTARHVTQAVKSRRDVKKKDKKKKAKAAVKPAQKTACSDAFLEASDALLEVVQDEADSGFKTTSPKIITDFCRSIIELVEAV